MNLPIQPLHGLVPIDYLRWPIAIYTAIVLNFAPLKDVLLFFLCSLVFSSVMLPNAWQQKIAEAKSFVDVSLLKHSLKKLEHFTIQ